MNPHWPERAFIFIQENQLIPANASYVAIDPDTGGGETFGNLRLSADGEEPVTHYACNTLVTPTMRTQVLDAFDNRPWTVVYQSGDGWTWESALADMGLQVIVSDVV